MKTILKKMRLLSVLLISSSISTNAQDMIPAIVGDIPIATPSNVNYLTNTVYDGTALIYGTAWMNGADSYFYIEDPVGATNTGVQTIAHTLPSGIAFPNIVIGAVDNSQTVYYAGITYHYSAPGGVNSILMDVFELKFTGGGGAIQITGSKLAIPIATGLGMASSEPRMDIINKEQTGGTGVVYSDRVVITWQKFNAGVMEIYARSALLSDLYTNGAGATFTNSGLVATGTMLIPQLNLPDICGIERVVSGSVNDIAYITWMRGPNGQPHVRGWNVTANTFLAAALQVDLAGSIRPRIDGLDPHTQSGNGDPYYIAYGYAMPSQIRSYTTSGLVSNTQGANNNPYGDGISSNYSGFPDVACGPGNSYNIAFYAQGPNSIILEQMSWTNAYNNSCGCGGGATPAQDYFQVNSGSGVSQQVAHSCAWKYTANNITEPTEGLISWYDQAATTIYQKTYNSLAASPFKTASTSVSTTKNAEGRLLLSPNPATDILNISGLNSDADYTVTDIAGRTAMSGSLKASSAHIHTNSLAPGMYLLNIDGNEKIKFVKE